MGESWPEIMKTECRFTRSSFKQSKHSMLIPLLCVLGCFIIYFWYIWEEMVFLEGLVKLGEIRNVEVKNY